MFEPNWNHGYNDNPNCYHMLSIQNHIETTNDCNHISVSINYNNISSSFDLTYSRCYYHSIESLILKCSSAHMVYTCIHIYIYIRPYMASDLPNLKSEKVRCVYRTYIHTQMQDYTHVHVLKYTRFGRCRPVAGSGWWGLTIIDLHISTSSLVFNVQARTNSVAKKK